MAKESQSVGLSMIMLCMTLCFVYVIFFGMHGTTLQDELDALETQQGVYALTASAVQDNTVEEGEEAAKDIPINTVPVVTEVEEYTSKPVAAAPTNTAGKTFFSVQELFREEQVDTSGIYNLAGTWKWEGQLKSFGAVGLEGYQRYILKNIDNTHFILLQSLPSDFKQQILTKGGNVVEITDKNTIKENQLVGDMLRYIQLPSYEGIKILQLVFFGNDVWYMQVDHDVYEQRKQQFIDLFDVRYDR